MTSELKMDDLGDRIRLELRDFRDGKCSESGAVMGICCALMGSDTKGTVAEVLARASRTISPEELERALDAYDKEIVSLYGEHCDKDGMKAALRAIGIEVAD